MKIVVIVLSLLLLSVSAEAAMHKWIDDKGKIHYTDSINKIPKKYRAAKKSFSTTKGRPEAARKPYLKSQPGESFNKTEDVDNSYPESPTDVFKAYREEIINGRVEEAERYASFRLLDEMKGINNIPRGKNDDDKLNLDTIRAFLTEPVRIDDEKIKDSKAELVITGTIYGSTTTALFSLVFEKNGWKMGNAKWRKLGWKKPTLEEEKAKHYYTVSPSEVYLEFRSAIVNNHCEKAKDYLSDVYFWNSLLEIGGCSEVLRDTFKTVRITNEKVNVVTAELTTTTEINGETVTSKVELILINHNWKIKLTGM